MQIKHVKQSLETNLVRRKQSFFPIIPNQGKSPNELAFNFWHKNDSSREQPTYKESGRKIICDSSNLTMDTDVLNVSTITKVLSSIENYGGNLGIRDRRIQGIANVFPRSFGKRIQWVAFPSCRSNWDNFNRHGGSPMFHSMSTANFQDPLSVWGDPKVRPF